ncbi:MAG TPA: hypothetical protein VK137_08465, partial [Planctomycetaceae bacterium]|nr:hypothetical protein [Planctomycetaceae bacterium]
MLYRLSYLSSVNNSPWSGTEGAKGTKLYVPKGGDSTHIWITITTCCRSGGLTPTRRRIRPAKRCPTGDVVRVRDGIEPPTSGRHSDSPSCGSPWWHLES